MRSRPQRVVDEPVASAGRGRASRIRIGISSCLLGQKVRYDGGHKRDSWIVGTLGRHVEFVPVCPEVAIGLGVPRPPIHLVGGARAPRAVGRDDSTLDVTHQLAAYGRRMAHQLDDVSGYVFKSRSPSCGIARVPVHHGDRARSSRGIYADAFLRRQPSLPAEEEGRLGDPDYRDNFLERVFAYQRWQQLMARGVTAARLAQFHAAHDLALMAHSPRAAVQLGRLVTRAARGRARGVADEYLAGFMAALSKPATAARHECALRHLLRYLKRRFDRTDYPALSDEIRRFRAGKLPRATLLAQWRRHCRRLNDPWIMCQTYLYPAAQEQRLRGL